MRRLHRSILSAGSAAPSVPGMWPSLEMRQIGIRRGELTMIAGQAGAGKSTFALSLANRAKVPVLYISADTHAHTQSMRLISMITGSTTDVVENAMQDKSWASEVLKQADWITWSFESALDIQTIEEEILAHIELHGVAPDVVVADNLTDIVGDGGDEWSMGRNLTKDMKTLARTFDTAMVVLHHTADSYLEPNTCPPRWAIMGKLSQTPATILTLAQNDAGFMGVAAVKSRYSKASPDGKDVTWLRYDPSTMSITDPLEEEMRNG